MCSIISICVEYIAIQWNVMVTLETVNISVICNESTHPEWKLISLLCFSGLCTGILPYLNILYCMSLVVIYH